MPEVYIHAIEGRTKEQKRALIKDITDAVVKNFDMTADAVLVEIVESSRDNKAKGRRAVQRTLSSINRVRTRPRGELVGGVPPRC
jgi:4-oxalocrotonate tautomerase